nr:DNA translocase FtsK [Brevibacillus marinus]
MSKKGRNKMWKWLHKLWRLLVNEAEGKQRPEGDDVRAVKPRPLQARAKAIYPRERQRHREAPPEERLTARRGRFRFPVIPDEPRRTASVRDEQPTPYELFRQAPAKSKQAPEASVHEQIQSDILSPIYGRIDPNRPYERGFRPSESTQLAPAAEQSEAPHREGQGSEPVPPAVPTAEEGVSGRHDAAAESGFDKGEADTGLVDRHKQPGSLLFTTDSALLSASAEGVNGEGDEPVAPPAVGGAAESSYSETTLDEGRGVAGTQAGSCADAGETSAAEPVASAAGAAMDAAAPAAPAGEREAAAEQAVAAGEQEVAAAVPTHDQQLLLAEPRLVLDRPPAAGASAASSFGEPPAERADATYRFPPLHLLQLPPQTEAADEASTLEQKRLLEETLHNFNVLAQVVGIVRGPTVTRFELQPAPGVKVNKITGLADDIKLSLSAKDIRIEAPIPGRNAVGIEVPNRKSMPVYIRQIIGSPAFRNHPSPLAVALGMDIGGEAIVADIKKMPHGLIAGATGSGKSVCINSIIVSLLYKARPDQVRLLLIDPKMVELAPYNHLPHLVTPVVTDAKQATAALKWAVEEMERRYALFVEAGARDIERYNRMAEESLPYIVIVIDELADLMMVAPQDVEDAIIRIAQKARACGIHLLLATQRPSVDVITGNIKANVPTRLAFAVFSQVDSRTILDQAGAERLLGRGDMLFLESGAAPVRLQGNFVSDDEIERVTQMIKQQRKPDYLFTREELEQSVHTYDAAEDPLYWEALVHVAEQGQASASALQRRFRIGYNRAARLIEMMEADGYVAGQSGGKPRTVLITAEDAKALAQGTNE